MNEEAFMFYIEHVLFKELKDKKTVFPVIVFVDGHRSHVGTETVKLCQRLDIILVALYPNATHIIQPLDVAIFAALKAAWSSYLRSKQNSDFTFRITAQNFASTFKKVYDDSVDAEKIHSAFMACGIYPWDKNAMKFERCMENCRTRDDFPSHQSEFIFETNDNNGYLFGDQNESTLIRYGHSFIFFTSNNIFLFFSETEPQEIESDFEIGEGSGIEVQIREEVIDTEFDTQTRPEDLSLTDDNSEQSLLRK
jgi:hypothetical protein